MFIFTAKHTAETEEATGSGPTIRSRRGAPVHLLLRGDDGLSIAKGFAVLVHVILQGARAGGSCGGECFHTRME